MTPNRNFLIRGVLPSDENEARCLKWKANYYVILDGELLKRGLTTPLLKCLNSQQVDYVMGELHDGICGLHTRERSLTTKVVHSRYYWPTLRADALGFIKRSRWCQEFANVPRTPSDNLHSLYSPWPFAMWVMDILGPLPKAPGVVKYLLVVINYFTKWIEDHYGNICRYDQWGGEIHLETPHMQVQPLIRPCHRQRHSIQSLNLQRLPSKARHQAPCHLIEHPQTNGQAEAANRVILRALRTRLDKSKGLWKEELPSILWAYHYSPQTTTNETLYRLTYDTDVMIPIEVGDVEPSTRRLLFWQQQNDENIRVEIETTDEVQDMIRIREEATKLWATRRKKKQRFNHESFNLVTSYGESEVKPKKILEWKSLAPTGKAHSRS